MTPPDASNPHDFASRTMSDWLAAVAAKTPAPGGGAVAASTLATAAALGRMVLAYTIGRARFAAHDAAHRACDARLADDLIRLPELATLDADGYAALNELQRLPESDPRRGEEMPSAVDGAIAPPLEMAERGARMAIDLLALVGTVNPWLGSDLAIAGDLAAAGTRAAARNVVANLDAVANPDRRARLAELVDRLRAEADDAGRRCEATATAPAGSDDANC